MKITMHFASVVLFSLVSLASHGADLFTRLLPRSQERSCRLGDAYRGYIGLIRLPLRLGIRVQ